MNSKKLIKQFYKASIRPTIEALSNKLDALGLQEYRSSRIQHSKYFLNKFASVEEYIKQYQKEAQDTFLYLSSYFSIRNDNDFQLQLVTGARLSPLNINFEKNNDLSDRNEHMLFAKGNANKKSPMKKENHPYHSTASKSTPQNTQKKPSQETKPQPSQDPYKVFDETKARLVSAVSIEREGKHLSLKTINQIYDTFLAFAEKPFHKLVQEDRKGTNHE